MEMNKSKIYVTVVSFLISITSVCAQDWPSSWVPKEIVHQTRKVFYVHGLSKDRMFYGPLTWVSVLADCYKRR